VILVVGAGISGLSAALFAARKGLRARVIERAPATGGLAAAEQFRGVMCDLGSHRLHPEALAGPLFGEMHREQPFLLRPRRGVLLFRGRRLAYPPSAIGMLRALGPAASLALAAGLARWDRAPDEEDAGFARFVRARVGEPAYAAFYAPYAEKVWGLDPEELSQTVAKKRVSTTAPWKLLRGGRALAHYAYPRDGVASIIAWLEARLAEHGVPIERGRAYDPAEAREEITFFAGDLRDLVPTSLEHRGLYLVYLALPGVIAGDAETYYAPEARYWFGRVSVPSRYSPALARAGETILTVEIPEGRWGTREDFASGSRLDALLEQLHDAGIAPRGARPIEARQRFVPGVYPLYRRGWKRAWREAMDRVAALGDVFPFGRQALFLHVNLDHCVDIARDVVDDVAAGGSARVWIGRAERYLDLRVRD
jgi:hypothetical protein